jgi:DedD protein
MEIRVRERLVGALVLVTIVVLLVPAVLKGPERAADAATGPETRSVVVELGDADQPAEDETLVPEPPQPQSAAAQPDSRPPPSATEPAASSELHGASPPAAVDTTRPAETAPAAGAEVETPAWAIQLGAFSTREKADDLVAKLRKRGYRAFVLEYRAAGKVLYRVRVGPEQDRERALAIAERLRKDGFQPVVAPHP